MALDGAWSHGLPVRAAGPLAQDLRGRQGTPTAVTILLGKAIPRDLGSRADAAHDEGEVAVAEMVDSARVFSEIAKAMVGAIERLSTGDRAVGRHAAFGAMMETTAVFGLAVGLTAEQFADAAARAWGAALAAGERA